MNFEEKINQLSGLINSSLPSMIGKKCVFLDCAYYENIGDVLIWEGTESFLKQNNISCIYRASKDTYLREKVPSGVTIILQGGGNFGDLWLPHQQFRLRVIQNHPNNKIVILPQTVFYKSMEIMTREASVMAAHPDLTICARDIRTEQLLKKFFSNSIVTLPDMAFCIPYYKLKKMIVPMTVGRNLFIKRRDKELSDINYSSYITEQVDVHDWPSYECVSKSMTRYSILYHYRTQLKMLGLGWLPDFYANHFLRPHFVKMGVKFLSEYDYIYTTRLHVAILATLLHKPCLFFDNSYGKNCSFFNTWLDDVEGIKFVTT